MEALRTPDECFHNLEGYDFTPKYIFLQNQLRMHFLEEGEGKQTILLLHGEPSWSYLYRKMIPVLVNSGFKIIAPDLIGFGKSDKPTLKESYTYQSHVDWLTEFILKKDITNLTLFCQDWGGLLGLRIAAENADRFSRIIAANTFLPTGDLKPGEDFLRWREFSQKIKKLPISQIIQNGCVEKLSPEVLKAYNAPFPEEKYKIGARVFPTLVPISPDDPASEANRKAWEVLRKWDKPFLTAFSDSDPITRGGDLLFRKFVPGAKKRNHPKVASAGHFLQEDKGEELAKLIIQFVRETEN